MRTQGMRLAWQKDASGTHRFIAESVRFRFVLIDPPRGKTHLWVQHVADDWNTKPIDQRPCTSRRHAQRLAQRFEDSAHPRRLR